MEPPLSIYDSLLKTSLVLADGDRRVLHTFGLTLTQYSALQLLDLHVGQRLVDMAEALLCERSTITRIVDRLESDGLVQRKNDPEDRRTQRVVLTPTGLELKEQSRKVHAESVYRRMSLLNGTEQDQLTRMLEKLLAGLRATLE